MIPENSNLFKQFDQKRNLYYICCMVVAIVAGLGYTWSIVQTPFVQKLGGTSVTATVALCYTFTVLCSTMSPTILGGLTRHLKINQMILIGGILFGGGYFLTGYINSIPMLFLTYGVGTGVGAVAITEKSRSPSIDMPSVRGIGVRGSVSTSTLGRRAL